MDFMLGLSKTQQGNDSIFLVVDRFCKMDHFIPRQKISDVAVIIVLFFEEFVRLHGLLKSITLDKDTEFMGHFWRTLWKKINSKLQFSSANHPQNNGYTEVMNRNLGNFLRCFIND